MSQPPDTRASSAEACLREGRLDEALETLQADIRRRPQDKALRVFLFQLLAVNGAWERALADHLCLQEDFPDEITHPSRKAGQHGIWLGFGGKDDPRHFAEAGCKRGDRAEQQSGKQQTFPQSGGHRGFL